MLKKIIQFLFLFSLFSAQIYASTINLGTNPANSITGYLTLGVTSGITASTTQSQGQGALTTSINEVSTVGNANDVVTLPTASAGRVVYIINNGANTLQVYPASGDDIDGTGVDTSVIQATGGNFMYVAHDATNWNRVNSSL